MTTLRDPRYTDLERILLDALRQASEGKGKERHATDEPWPVQLMVAELRILGRHHGAIYRAWKKLRESVRKPPEAAKREILGAIVYADAAIRFLEESS